MKFLTFIIALFLSCGDAFAADFRTLNFGESCSDARTGEYQLGNNPKNEQNPLETYHAFNGVFLDRMVTIVYYCGEDNKLDKGLYFYSFTNEPDLEAFISIAKPKLENLLGPPAFDGSILKSDEKNDILKHALRWEKERFTIHVKVIGNFNEPNPQKRFQIWFRPIE